MPNMPSHPLRICVTLAPKIVLRAEPFAARHSLMNVNRLHRGTGMRDIQLEECRRGSNDRRLHMRNKMQCRCVTKLSFTASETE